LQKIKKVIYTKTLKDTLLIGIGVFTASLGLKGFLIPNGFIDGGVVGVSLLIKHLTGIPLSWLLLVLNLPFVLLAAKQVSVQFSIKTFLSITALALSLWWINIPNITSDKLLIAVFGGMLLGAGIGFCIRAGSVIDGTEVLALFLTKKTPFSIGDIILIINVIIFTFAAVLLGAEKALYSILTYLSASKTVDFIVQGFEEYIGITIISQKSAQIKEMLVHELNRGVTIYKGQTGYGKKGSQNQDIDIIYTVVTRLQINKIKTEIEKVDDIAFVVETPVYNTKGGMIKKRPFH